MFAQASWRWRSPTHRHEPTSRLWSTSSPPCVESRSSWRAGSAPQEAFAAVADRGLPAPRRRCPRRSLASRASTISSSMATAGGPAPVGYADHVRAGHLARPGPPRESAPCASMTTRRELDADLAVQFGLAASVAAPISVEGEVWGMLTGTSDGQPLPAGTEHRLQQFAALVAAALANSQARADIQALADEQAALRRVAELIAQEAPADEVLEAVAVQASRLAGVDFTTLVALRARRLDRDRGARRRAGELRGRDATPGSGDGAIHRVWRTGRAARDRQPRRDVGPMAAARSASTGSRPAPRSRSRSRAGCGARSSSSAAMNRLPPSIESHLTDFAELASTAIFAAQAREELHALADEQAALRRVAELVARGAALDEVFGAVAAEASTLLGEIAAAVLRYDPAEVAVAVAGPTGGGTTLAVPMIVEGQVWGALTATTSGDLPPAAGTEERLAQFAGARRGRDRECREQGKADRLARARRRHGRRDPPPTPTRPPRRRPAALVHALITLALAREAASRGRAVTRADRRGADPRRAANSELRDLVRGILPASLTRGGLRAAIESLAVDIPLPIELDVTARRFAQGDRDHRLFRRRRSADEHRQTRARHACEGRCARRPGGGPSRSRCHDDGAGGADPASGTGLTGLSDRIDASGGTLEITSPAGVGTTLPRHAAARG